MLGLKLTDVGVPENMRTIVTTTPFTYSNSNNHTLSSSFRTLLYQSYRQHTSAHTNTCHNWSDISSQGENQSFTFPWHRLVSIHICSSYSLLLTLSVVNTLLRKITSFTRSLDPSVLVFSLSLFFVTTTKLDTGRWNHFSKMIRRKMIRRLPLQVEDDWRLPLQVWEETPKLLECPSVSRSKNCNLLQSILTCIWITD
jgi:hypothetical protein